MATVVGWRFRRYAAYPFAIAALVAYSRVYVGVHYPFDVIAGAIVGIILGNVSIKLVVAVVDWWRKRRRDEGDVLS